MDPTVSLSTFAPIKKLGLILGFLIIGLLVFILFDSSKVNAITRDQVIQNAEEYLNLEWTPTSDNIEVSVCGGNSNWFSAGTTYHGMAYARGRYDTTAEFILGLDNDKMSGYEQDSSCSTGRGIDCSGLISKVWDLGAHRSSTELNSDTYSTILNNPEEELMPGDIIARNGHVLLFKGWSNGKVLAIESDDTNYCGTYKGVRLCDDYTWGQFNSMGFSARRYNNIEESISIPQTVTTVAFQGSDGVSRLYQARINNASLLVRDSSDGNTWTSWEATNPLGRDLDGNVSMIEFTNSNGQKRFYQVVRSSEGEILMRYTTDGVFNLAGSGWGDEGWIVSDGNVTTDITMVVYNHGLGDSLYQAARGQSGEVYMRFTYDGDFDPGASGWNPEGWVNTGGEASSNIAMTTFTHAGQTVLFQAVRGTSGAVFTRLSYDGYFNNPINDPSESWVNSGGETNGEISVGVYNPNGTSERIYLTITGKDANDIYTRYSTDGTFAENPALWGTPQGQADGNIYMHNFSSAGVSHLYQIMRGSSGQVYNRFTVDGDFDSSTSSEDWSATEVSGTSVGNLEIFNPGDGNRLYQSVVSTIGSTSYTRYLKDGDEYWTGWTDAWSPFTESTGSTIDSISMVEFNNKLYQSLIGDTAPYKVWVRSSADGVFDGNPSSENWSNSLDGTSIVTATLAVFNNRLYISTVRSTGKIYTKSMDINGTWDSSWQETGGGTYSSVGMDSVNGTLYQVIKSKSSNVLYMRSTIDGVFDGRYGSNSDQFELWTVIPAIESSHAVSLHGLNSTLFMGLRASDGIVKIYSLVGRNPAELNLKLAYGKTGDTPALATHTDNGVQRLYVAAKGNTTNNIYIIHATETGWSDWVQLEGRTPYAPCMSSFSLTDELYQTVIGESGAILTRHTL